jgi:glutamate-5-semialdehyde dehydrogenase
MATTAQPVAEICAAARRASRSLAQLDTGTKNAALLAMAEALEARTGEILEARRPGCAPVCSTG